MALLIGTFDVDDKSKSSGIPFINRKTELGSYQKLIKHHEAKLNDPYNKIERGGAEEYMFKMALNRKFLEDVTKSLKMPWLRMFYSIANLAAAKELGEVNSAVKPEVNEAAAQIDNRILAAEAAAQIKEVIDSNKSYANDESRSKAQERAVANVAGILAQEWDVKRAGVVNIEDDIKRQLDIINGHSGGSTGKPVTSKESEALALLRNMTAQTRQPALA